MGRFEIRIGPEGLVSICDTESGYDVELAILGKFTNLAHEQEYAQAVVQALNAAAIPTREFSQYDESGRLRTLPLTPSLRLIQAQ